MQVRSYIVDNNLPKNQVCEICCGMGWDEKFHLYSVLFSTSFCLICTRQVPEFAYLINIFVVIKYIDAFIKIMIWQKLC
jgi:hypothetical protein